MRSPLSFELLRERLVIGGSLLVLVSASRSIPAPGTSRNRVLLSFFSRFQVQMRAKECVYSDARAKYG
jgi:hypothetical protein